MQAFQRFLSFALLYIILVGTSTLQAQTYQILIDGTNWETLDGTIRPVCPNTEYFIRIDPAFTTYAYDNSLRGSAGVEFSEVISSTFSSTYCGVYTAAEERIGKVKFPYAVGNSTITIVGGSCATTGGSTFNFTTLPIAPTMPSDGDICEGNGAYSMSATITHTGSATYEWFKTVTIGGTPTTTNFAGTETGGTVAYTIPAGDLTTPGTIDLTLVVTLTSGLLCVDESEVQYTIRNKPDNLSIAFDPGASTLMNPSAGNSASQMEICVDGTTAVTVGAADYFPSLGATAGVPNKGYKLIARDRASTDLSGATVEEYGPILGAGATPESAVFSIAPNGASNLEHGLYDLVLIATNEYGCESAPYELNACLTINDKPGVQIYHSAGDPTFATNISADTDPGGGNTIEICTGERLQLRATACNAGDYEPDDYTVNSTDKIAPPNQRPNVPDGISSGDQPYTTPCGPSGAYFQTEVWSVKDSWCSSLFRASKCRY